MEDMSTAEREQLLQNVYEKGFQLEQRYYGCSQCVVAALQDYFPIHDAVFKAATSLSGGIASTIEGPCGAFTAGILVFSSFYGRSKEKYSDISLLRKPGPLVRVLWDKFTAAYGGYTCREIQNHLFGQSYHFLDGNEYRAYEEQGGHEDKCPAVVGRSCVWIAELLLEHKAPRRRI